MVKQRWHLLTVVIVASSLVATHAQVVRTSQGMKGDNIATLIKTLLSKGKSEFETTLQYEERQRSLLPRFKQYRFLYSYVGCSCEYDADQGVMILTLHTTNARLQTTTPVFGSTIHDELASVTLAKENTNERRVSGQTALGIKSMYRSLEVSEYGVVFTPDAASWLSKVSNRTQQEARRIEEEGLRTVLRARLYSPSFIFSIDAVRAREVKSWLRLVLVGTVLTPAIFRNDSYSKATVTDLLELTTHQFYLPLNLTEIQIVDVRNNGVIARFSR